MSEMTSDSRRSKLDWPQWVMHGADEVEVVPKADADRYRDACEAASRAIPANWKHGSEHQRIAYERLTEALYGDA